MPVSVKDLMQGNQAIAILLRKLEKQRELLSQARKLLPEPLRIHCLHLVIKEREMVIFTDAPVWAHRLNFATRQLQNLLPDAERLTRVRLKVLPLVATPKSQTRPTRPQPVSEGNQRLLRQLANDITDAELSAALMRLVKRVAKKSSD